MDAHALLVRYEVLAANRRHFEALFFAVVAFSAVYALAAGATLRWITDCAIAFPLIAGATFITGGFVAHRLFKRERSAFVAMCHCWSSILNEQPAMPNAKVKAGAMAFVVAGLYAAGVALLVLPVAQALLAW